MDTTSRKSEILAAALAEFSHKSYDESSLNTILKNAGCSKGSFYYHFTDKKDLYLCLLRSAVEAKWEFIRSRSQLSDSPKAGNIFELFQAQARIGAQFAAMHPDHHQLGRMFSMEKGNPIYREASELLGADSESILADMIDQAIRSGTFDDRFSREFLIRLLSYLFTHFEEIFDGGKDMPMEATLTNLDLFVDFLQHGTQRRQKNG